MKYNIPDYEFCAKMGMKSLHGCIIYIKGYPLVQVTNLPEGYVFGCYVPSIHAEMNAIYLANKQIKNFKNATLVVVRYTKDGKLANSYPCNHCINLIKMCGIKTVYYSIEDNNGSLVKIKTKNLEMIHISSGMRRLNIDNINYKIL